MSDENKGGVQIVPTLDEEIRDQVIKIVALIPMATGAKLTEVGWEKYGENEQEAIEKLLQLIKSHTSREALKLLDGLEVKRKDYTIDQCSIAFHNLIQAERANYE